MMLTGFKKNVYDTHLEFINFRKNKWGKLWEQNIHTNTSEKGEKQKKISKWIENIKVYVAY